MTIFQLNNGKSDQLRQTFMGKSKWCAIDNNNRTVHIKVFPSTFSLPNMTYYVKIESGFVINKNTSEPLFGVTEDLWRFSTGKINFNIKKSKIMY